VRHVRWQSLHHIAFAIDPFERFLSPSESFAIIAAFQVSKKSVLCCRMCSSTELTRQLVAVCSDEPVIKIFDIAATIAGYQDLENGKIVIRPPETQCPRPSHSSQHGGALHTTRPSCRRQLHRVESVQLCVSRLRVQRWVCAGTGILVKNIA
jgi:hypothetical protein